MTAERVLLGAMTALAYGLVAAIAVLFGYYEFTVEMGGRFQW